MNQFFHGRSSAPIGRPVAPELQQERRPSGTGWNALVISEPSAAVRWAAAGFPTLVEGEERTEAEKLRVVEMLRVRKAASRPGVPNERR